MRRSDDLPNVGRDRGGLFIELVLERVVPDPADEDEPRVENPLARIDLPIHARLLESLREHAFATGFGDAAADRKLHRAIGIVLHELSSFRQIASGFRVSIL